MCSLLNPNQFSEAALKAVKEDELRESFYARIFKVEQFEETYHDCDASSVVCSVGYWVELIPPCFPPSLNNFAMKGLFIGAEFLVYDGNDVSLSDEEIKCQTPTAEQIVKNVLLLGVEAELTPDLVRAATIEVVDTSFSVMERPFPRLFEELAARTFKVPLEFD